MEETPRPGDRNYLRHTNCICVSTAVRKKGRECPGGVPSLNVWLCVFEWVSLWNMRSVRKSATCKRVLIKPKQSAAAQEPDEMRRRRRRRRRGHAKGVARGRRWRWQGAWQVVLRVKSALAAISPCQGLNVSVGNGNALIIRQTWYIFFFVCVRLSLTDSFDSSYTF